MKNILFIPILILSFITYGQQSHDASSTVSGGFTIGKVGVKGSPYLFDKWVNGYAVDSNGNLSEQKSFLYDIYNNKLFFKTNNSQNVLVLDDSRYVGFILKINNEDCIFKKISGDSFSKNKKETKYYQLAKAPSDKVIIEENKSFKDPNSSGWSSSRYNNKGGEYKMNTYYYVLNKDKKYVKVNLKQSSILKVYKDKKKQVSDYIKQHNYTLKTPSDLVPIVEFYHSL